jgi:DNA mismatch endonuclease, patch repair protein
MADVLTPEQRRRCMAAIRGRDTKPEMLVRSLVHRMGYRFRLHRKDLPGKPDLVFPSRRKVIFVHGCFWHQHSGCRFATRPVTRRAFWDAKLHANRRRDWRNQRKLRGLGWGVMVVWECQTRDLTRLERRLHAFLG